MMSYYIQRGANTRYRNHLLVDRIPVDTREPDWVDRMNKVLCWCIVGGLVALVLGMAAAAF